MTLTLVLSGLTLLFLLGAIYYGLKTRRYLRETEAAIAETNACLAEMAAIARTRRSQ